MSAGTGGAADTVPRPGPEIREFPAAARSGWPVLGLAAAAAVAGIVLVSVGICAPVTTLIGPGIALLAAAAGVASGLTAVGPGDSRVVQILGRYAGTIRAEGLSWVNPAARRLRVSTKIRNHETATVKVNDADGNPIDIAAVVVWRVADTAQAVYGVDSFVAFVAVQAETALRQVASDYPYDDHGGDRLSLRAGAGEASTRLAAELAQRVAPAGIKIIETRFTRVAYAPEIAHAMLRRQQAGAMVAARQKIVDGAVGMVEAALARLDADGFVELDPERKAAMVSNMLVVLCSDHPTHPVVNTGTLYH